LNHETLAVETNLVLTVGSPAKTHFCVITQAPTWFVRPSWLWS